jgi:murein DD-endopeptidase MepM/ murein hydrolase activator NlpD
MTENELEALVAKLRAGIDLTNEELIKMARHTGYMSGQFKRLEVGVDEFAKNLKKAGDELPTALLKSAGDTVKSLGGVAKSLGEADTGFKSLTPIIEAASKALGNIPAIGFLFTGAAEAGKFMINQLQNATDAFQEISKVGGLTARGMSGLQEQFLASGMQLKSYTKTIAANSAALANFAGSVGNGAEQFSRTAGMVQKEFGQGLGRLGFTIDEIGETTATYMSQQTRLGLAQGKSSEMLAHGAKRYMLELDELTKLTGASKEELKKQQDAAMGEARFRAKLDQLVSEGKVEEAENLKKTQSLISSQNEEMGRAFRDAASGYVSSEEAKRGFMATGGALMDLAKKAETADPTAILEELRTSVNATIPVIRSQALVGNEYAGTYGKLSDFANGIVRDGKAIKDIQNQQTSGKGDDLTDKTVAAQRKLQDFSIGIQKLGFEYMPAAATAIKFVADSVDDLLSAVAKETGTKAKTLSGEPAKEQGMGSKIVDSTLSLTGSVIGGIASGITTVAKSGYQAFKGGQSGATPGTTAAPGTTAVPGPTAALGAGPAFSRPDDARADKVQLTLEEIREEIKKLVAVGGISTGAAGGQQAAQAALAEHDHAHPHGEKGATVDPEVAKQLAAGMVNPLKNMVQTSGMMRNDGKTYHGGIDLGGKIGDAIMAPISGKITRVLEAGKGDGGFGNAVEIEDTVTGMKHMLAHMDKSMAKVGDTVKAGTQIGTLGNTGQSTGPHLHHEIKDRAGKRIDPTQFYTGVKDTQGRAIAGAGAGLGSTQTAGAPAAPGMPEGPIMAKSELKGQQREFYDKLYTTLLDQAAKAGLKNPEAVARVGAAQASLETGYGKATAGGNNYFGIKGSGGNQQTTQEFDPKLGKMVTQKASFRQYGSMEESAADYIKLMQGSKRYAGVIGAGSTAEAIAAQGKSGYATDPDYAKKLALITSSATGQGFNLAGGATRPAGTSATLATPTAPVARPSYASATAGLAGQGQDVISSGLSAITTALFGGSPAGAAGGADAGVSGSEAVTLLSQLVALSRDQNSNLSKILSASTA